MGVVTNEHPLLDKLGSKKSFMAPATSSSAVHPPYLQMISEAITSLKDRTGSSQPAIAKFMEEQYKTSLPPNFKKILSVQLKKFVKSEKLTKVKNSYKVSAPEKFKLQGNSAKQMQNQKQVKESGSSDQIKGTKKVITEKAVEKTKRLTLVKTPEALNKKPNVKSSVKSGKLKRLSQIKTPDAVKVMATSNSLKSFGRKGKN